MTAITNVEAPNYQWSLNGELVQNNSDRINVYIDGIYTVSVYDSENDYWGEASYFIEGLSIEEVKTEITLYPNLSNIIINIYSNKVDDVITSLEVNNLQGKRCLTENESKNMIIIESLMPGQYILKINTVEACYFNKFIKSN